MKPRKPGEVVGEFDVDKGRRNFHVIIRHPEMSDLDQVLAYINAVTRETEFLRINKKITRKEEMQWLRNAIMGMRTGKKIVLFSEIAGRISGVANVESAGGASSHVGTIGVSLREKYTNMGIGTKFIQMLMNEAAEAGFEVLRLSHFSNERAKHVYEKLGFIHIGVIPRARKSRKGKYADEFIMCKVVV